MLEKDLLDDVKRTDCEANHLKAENHLDCFSSELAASLIGTRNEAFNNLEWNLSLANFRGYFPRTSDPTSMKFLLKDGSCLFNF